MSNAFCSCEGLSGFQHSIPAFRKDHEGEGQSFMEKDPSLFVRNFCKWLRKDFFVKWVKKKKKRAGLKLILAL